MGPPPAWYPCARLWSGNAGARLSAKRERRLRSRARLGKTTWAPQFRGPGTGLPAEVHTAAPPWPRRAREGLSFCFLCVRAVPARASPCAAHTTLRALFTSGVTVSARVATRPVKCQLRSPSSISAQRELRSVINSARAGGGGGGGGGSGGHLVFLTTRGARPGMSGGRTS